MIQYIIRRLMYTIPLLLGVNILTFFLFFVVNTPDDMARMQLGQKHVTEQAVSKWKIDHGYDLPLFINSGKDSFNQITETIFYQKSIKLFVFQFGVSDSGRNIGADIKQRMWPSLAVALPSLMIGLLVNILAALLMVLFRQSYLEFWGLVACVVIMSISVLFYIIGGQFLFSKLLKLVPISGFGSGVDALKFLILPVVISVVSGLGSGGRWYRALFIEEVEKDYVVTARAKGLSETQVLFRHVLGNAMIPILTGVVVVLPLLFMGSLIMESFFSIPGLGSYTIDAINRQDFAIVRSMVFLGSVLYIIGLLLTDICYTLVDPRVKLL
ncbi:MAG: ABC transporter permease [Methylococcales bacterium]|nr:ABC transporter permease [Methylococcaceae bacterium]HIL40885.1 ABC transporter permease [Methylococcales bacterium]